MIRENLHVADPQRREMEAHLYKEEVMHMLTMHQSSSSLASEGGPCSPRSEDTDPGGCATSPFPGVSHSLSKPLSSYDTAINVTGMTVPHAWSIPMPIAPNITESTPAAAHTMTVRQRRTQTVSAICCGTGTAVFFQRWLCEKLLKELNSDVSADERKEYELMLERSFDIEVNLVCEADASQRAFMRPYLRPGTKIEPDLRTLVYGFMNGTVDPADFYSDYLEITAPCYGNTGLRHYNDSPAHDSGDLFRLSVIYAAYTRPKRVFWEMTAPQGHDYEDHAAAFADMKAHKLHPRVTERFPACYAGDGTHRDRWIACGSSRTVPDFELLDYCKASPSPMRDYLQPVDSIPSELWLTNRNVNLQPHVFEGEIKHNIRNDDRYADKHDLGQFSSRSRVAGHIDHSHAKEDKFYDIDYTAPTITRYHLRILDRRRVALGFALHDCVRCMTVEEAARMSSFLPPQRAFLATLPHDKAM